MSDREQTIWGILALILMIIGVVSIITEDYKPKTKPLDMAYSKRILTDSILRDTQLDYFWLLYRGYKLYPQQYNKPEKVYYTIEPDYQELMDMLEEINQNQINGNNKNIHVLGEGAHSRNQCKH